ncbi:MAG TPA: hypothetical protein VGS96_20325, partial [Thermoanaerobaculia bacterium]|nr:hypothetical protein [Thermoanaerobaculia bacterium]
GFADAFGSAARFNSPRGVTVDSSGNVFVAEDINDMIRRVAPDGTVTTVAGAPNIPGSTDGKGENARFRNPWALAIDSSGNLYVSDTTNHTIRKITADGTVSTLAGKAGTSGSTDGNGSAALFNNPHGIAVDGTTIYVADYNNHTIRKIVGNQVTTFAGEPGSSGAADGNGRNARFNRPKGIAVDRSGDLIVADSQNHTLRRIAPDAIVTTIAGSAGMLGSSDGPATTTARFTVPNAVGVDRNGDIYITELNKHAIRVLSNGNVSSFSGATIPGWVDGPAAAARFNAPTNIATDSFGAVYVADTKNHAIRKIDAQRNVSTLAGKPAAAIDGSGDSAGFIAPANLARDAAGNLYVADAGSNSIRKVTGRMVTTIATGVFSPSGVTVDGAGNVFFVEYGQRVWKVSPAGTATIYAGTGTRGGDDGPALSATFNLPQAIVVDTAGNLFVAEIGNSSIRKISPSGKVTTFVGQNGSPGDADGQGSAARLSFPTSLAIDNDGNLYVADSANGKIRKITPSAVVTTVATVSQPTGVAIDASGVLWTTDSQNTVRRIRQDGTIEIVGGSPGKAGNDNGMGQAARFNGLAGIVVIADQTVVVSDGLNNTLRLGIPKTARRRNVHR